MTAIRSAIKPTRRPGELGVHSVDRFHFAVPDLAVAKNFYGEFGLELNEDSGVVAMKTHGNPHVWVTIGEGPRKKLGLRHHPRRSAPIACWRDGRLSR